MSLSFLKSEKFHDASVTEQIHNSTQQQRIFTGSSNFRLWKKWKISCQDDLISIGYQNSCWNTEIAACCGKDTLNPQIVESTYKGDTQIGPLEAQLKLIPVICAYMYKEICTIATLFTFTAQWAELVLNLLMTVSCLSLCHIDASLISHVIMQLLSMCWIFVW